MSLFKSDDNCSVCQERAVKAEPIKAAERPDPLSHIDTHNEYALRGPVPQDGEFFGFSSTLMIVRYSSLNKSVEIEVSGKAINLSKAQFDDLRKVLHAFAFDPKFNGGAEGQV